MAGTLAELEVFKANLLTQKATIQRDLAACANSALNKTEDTPSLRREIRRLSKRQEALNIKLLGADAREQALLKSQRSKAELELKRQREELLAAICENMKAFQAGAQEYEKALQAAESGNRNMQTPLTRLEGLLYKLGQPHAECFMQKLGKAGLEEWAGDCLIRYGLRPGGLPRSHRLSQESFSSIVSERATDAIATLPQSKEAKS